MRKPTRWLALFAVLALVAAACAKNGGTTAGNGSTSSGPTLASFDPSAQGEGALNLIAWPGYTQKAWVRPFEQESGCKVSLKYGNTSDQMVNLMRQQGGTLYDGVSASGDATNRLIAGGDVAPIDTTSFPEYADVMQTLQAPPHNTVDGVHYGVPYMWGPNILMYNTNVVKTAPTSWNVVFDPSSPYAGKVTAYDSPIYIADAALYLKAHQPDLNITDPYELTQNQFDAAISLLKQQNPLINKYWAIYTDEIDGFENGDMVVGTAWPVNQSILVADGTVPVASVIPSEGVTGWADTWMMSANAPHPVCMLKWMEYSLRPAVQTQVAEYYGATPSNTASCAQLDKDLGKDAANYHCGDDAFLSNVALWKTPLSDCGDNRGSTCIDYATWTEKWLEVTGGA
ncbi:MAG: ABC transporter substrate-binding protein [Actinobacteria bacterium]|nr:ABC transporter substrate-binding protein [Actinomycetota bacterium]